MSGTAPKNKRKRTGIKRLLYATGNSLNGIKDAFIHEASFRQEILLSCILIPAALILPVALFSKAMMIASVLLVLIVELINSAIETICDFISMEDHPLAKRAKDMGSGAVLLSLFNATFIWIYVLLKYFL